MIWATVRSRSCFCWLYRTSPSSAAESIINLIFSIDHLVESSLVLLAEGVYFVWPVRSLGKTLLASAQLHFVLQGHLACYSRYFPTSYFSIPAPYDEKDIFYWLFVRQPQWMCEEGVFSSFDFWNTFDKDFKVIL